MQCAVFGVCSAVEVKGKACFDTLYAVHSEVHCATWLVCSVECIVEVKGRGW